MNQPDTRVADYNYRMITHRESGGRLVWRLGPGETCEIVDIEVPNERRRDGVGRKMVYDLVLKVGPEGRQPQLAKTVFAVTREDNFVACQFYTGCSFKIAGLLRNFYCDSDAVVFVRKL